MKLSTFFAVVLATGSFVQAEEPVKERIEWIDIWVTDANKDDLPRVLLVGDSITRGYFGGVEQHLKGKAYCARLTTSKCVSDPTFNNDLQLLLEQYDFSVIHFNNGLHGWGYTEAQYKEGLQNTLTALKMAAGNAKLIWATSTPVNRSTAPKSFTERAARIPARNRIAAEIMKAHDVSTNDLFELVGLNLDWFSPDGVHFNAKGKDAQAKQVAESIADFLSSSGSANE